eukprot:CAMPEP_0194481680 /NCGR_PEP_ID=MMETSP0253-20130528/3992_1 /TAXON_ID=2966 /ORGANISM="Noctiluca scintillans" /LENGTH=139 /DNA_ID=CAMNT_0039321181 /DNA_START=79 /DNA_END=498 /DNA_ORIENTATION=-
MTSGEQMLATRRRKTVKQSGKVVSRVTSGPPRVLNETSQRRKRKIPATYSVYLYKVLKQIHPECSMSKRGMDIMNSFMNDIFDRIATDSVSLLRNTKKRTLTSREVEASVRLMLPGELSNHAVHEGRKAVDRYEQHMKM